MPQHADADTQKHREDQSGDVDALQLELAQTGAALSAVVAAALHGNGKLVGPAEGRNEQGYQQGHQGFGLLEQVAGIEVGAAGL